MLYETTAGHTYQASFCYRTLGYAWLTTLVVAGGDLEGVSQFRTAERARSSASALERVEVPAGAFAS